MKKLLLLAAASLFAATTFAADIEAGKAKAAVCAGCHGANGISAIPTYPNLAGQKAAYLVSSMKAYKAQERTGGQAPVMYGMVAALSDADIENLAAYFESLGN
ncbi:cytochrome c [Reinekea marina]|uniref:C-type cytochrome n=1 Tax=Reinekea marina TaxID=1310421 RepID=A0ABV7WSE2_9GAMM|nr:cytochrome c [Reinekea marina]MBU2864615.1 cytochrome c [Reinekea forsetii]MDN3647805.1 cytochrome c [Reinekea marina]